MDSHNYPMPPHTHGKDGKQRRIGVELEMNGLSLDRLAELAADFLDCRIEHSSRYERTLVGDPAGDWVVELDFALLKQLGREQRDNNQLSDELMSSAEAVLAWLSEALVPLELVSPPLPLERLPQVDQLIERLRVAGAKGTSDQLTNAFGMQLNPEVADSSAASLLAHLQAFLCLHDWLRQRCDIDLTRRLTSYVDPFPAEYLQRVLDDNYQPDLPTLIDDYLQYNPTRNRALDMLPLFRHLDEQRVTRAIDDSRIKARPTFHYRLPDCRIDQPGWGVRDAWEDWLQVERLAAQPQRLAACRRACLEHLDGGLMRLLDDWPAQVEQQWLTGSG